MSFLTHWSPFKSSALQPFDDVDQLFRSLNARSFLAGLEPTQQMRLDVNETDQAYEVKAEIPGVKKEDIAVSIEGDQVSIAAEIRHELDRKDASRLCRERYYGRVFRSFRLPVAVDADKAEAVYNNGLLSLTLPKKPNGPSKKIAVS